MAFAEVLPLNARALTQWYTVEPQYFEHWYPE